MRIEDAKPCAPRSAGGWVCRDRVCVVWRVSGSREDAVEGAVVCGVPVLASEENQVYAGEEQPMCESRLKICGQDSILAVGRAETQGAGPRRWLIAVAGRVAGTKLGTGGRRDVRFM